MLSLSPVKLSPPTNQHPAFHRPDALPVALPNQQCQSTEGKNITFHGLARPKLTWRLPTFSSTIKGSWLPWGRVAMPLDSSMTPVPHFY